MYFYENWDNIYKAKVTICQVKFLIFFFMFYLESILNGKTR